MAQEKVTFFLVFEFERTGSQNRRRGRRKSSRRWVDIVRAQAGAGLCRNSRGRGRGSGWTRALLI